MGKKFINVIAEIPEFSIVELDDGVGATVTPGWYSDKQLKRFLKYWDFPADRYIVERLQAGEIVLAPIEE